MRGIAVGPCLDDYGAFRRSAWRLIRVAVGTRGLAGEPLERLGEVVDVRKSALARYLPHRQAGVVEQVLGALYPQVQQELVWRPAESVAEDVREPGSREPGSRGHVGDGQRFREMQRHERGDPIQELRLILEICAPARVALQQPEHEACYKVVGLEPSEEVPALPDAYSLEHGVPELRGVQRDEFGRNGDPCHLIQSRLHEPFIDYLAADKQRAVKWMAAVPAAFNAPLPFSEADFPASMDDRVARQLAALSQATAKGNFGYTAWTFWPSKSDVYIQEEMQKVLTGDVTPAEFCSGLDDTFTKELKEGAVPKIIKPGSS